MEYRLDHTITEIAIADYIARYHNPDKFIEFCKDCDRYGACWACPPYNFDPAESISQYTNAFILGTKITPADNLRSRADALKGRNDTEEGVKEIVYRLIKEVRTFLDKSLLAAEERYPGSMALFAGTCHLCPLGSCTRIMGVPCIYPEKIRPSLEAFGFDIGKTSSELLSIELKWSSNEELPEYFVLVSGFFTNQNEGCITLDDLQLVLREDPKFSKDTPVHCSVGSLY